MKQIKPISIFDDAGPLSSTLADALIPYLWDQGLDMEISRDLALYDRVAVAEHYGAWSGKLSTAEGGVVLALRRGDEVVAHGAGAFHRHDGSFLDFVRTESFTHRGDRPRFKLGNQAATLAACLGGSFGFMGGIWVDPRFRGGPVAKGFLKNVVPLLRMAMLETYEPRYLVAMYRERLVRDPASARFHASYCVPEIVREDWSSRARMWLGYCDPVFVRADASYLIDTFAPMPGIPTPGI